MATFVPSKPPVPLESLDTKAMRFIMQENGSNAYALEAHNRGIKRIEDFGQYTKLRSIDLSFNQLTVLEGFHKILDLREIKLYANRLTSLEGLEKNSHMEKLIVHDNVLTDVPPALAKIRSLKILRLDRNRFTSAGSLARFSTLTYLDLSDNQLTSLKGIQNLVCLEELLVDRNELNDDGELQALADCKRLESLHLSDNHLSSFAGLEGLNSLEVLHIQRNHLTSLDSLPALPALTELYTGGNRLSSLQKLPDVLPKLDVLDARDNRLDDLDILLSTLANLKELKEAFLGQNPCTPPSTLSSGYAPWWYRCAKRLRHLERLDDIIILTAHRECAVSLCHRTDLLQNSIVSPSSVLPSKASSTPRLHQRHQLPHRPSTAPARQRQPFLQSTTITKPAIRGQPTRPLFHAPSARTDLISCIENPSSASSSSVSALLEEQAVHLREELKTLRESLRPTKNDKGIRPWSAGSVLSRREKEGVAAVNSKQNESMQEENQFHQSTPTTRPSGSKGGSSDSNLLRTDKKALGRALRYANIKSESVKGPLIIVETEAAASAGFDVMDTDEPLIAEREMNSSSIVLDDLEEEYKRLCREIGGREGEGGEGPETDDGGGDQCLIIDDGLEKDGDRSSSDDDDEGQDRKTMEDRYGDMISRATRRRSEEQQEEILVLAYDGDDKGDDEEKRRERDDIEADDDNLNNVIVLEKAVTTASRRTTRTSPHEKELGIGLQRQPAKSFRIPGKAKQYLEKRV